MTEHLFSPVSLRRQIRGNIAHAAKLAAKKKLIYTEGAARWDGIAHDRKAQRNEVPRYADCSSFYTWCTWTYTRKWDYLGDFLNGEDWLGGYTGSLTQHGEDVNAYDLLVGDAVFYGGSRMIPAHVAVYVGNGQVVSNGGDHNDPALYPTNLYNVLPIVRYKRYIR